MAAGGTVAYVAALPDCDLCHMDGVTTKAEYDARTVAGPYAGSWGYLCQEHFTSHGPGRLGTGYGQHLVVQPVGKARARAAQEGRQAHLAAGTMPEARKAQEAKNRSPLRGKGGEQ